MTSNSEFVRAVMLEPDGKYRLSILGLVAVHRFTNQHEHKDVLLPDAANARADATNGLVSLGWEYQGLVSDEQARYEIESTQSDIIAQALRRDDLPLYDLVCLMRAD